MARKRKNAAHNGGYIRPTKYGTFRAEIYVDGKQQRPTFKTRELAEGFIDRVRLAQERLSRPLSITETADALQALEALPDGVSLTDAARAWLHANQRPVDATTAREALAMLITEKEALDRRTRTSEAYRDHVGKFLRDSGLRDAPVHTIQTGDIKGWLQTCGYRGKSWNGYRGSLHAFFAWCVREGIARENPVAGIPVASVRKAPPVSMPVEHVKAFLLAAAKHDPELVAYYALAFFSGARTAELDRFEASCFQEGIIHIGPRQAKTGQQRYVTILPVLARWLAAFPPVTDGRLRVVNHRKRFRAVVAKIRADLPGFAWPRNATRHSFASYHLAAFRDSAGTAHELGHQNAGLLFSTYRTLATREDGEAFFALTPP